MVRGVDFCLDRCHTTWVIRNSPVNYFNSDIIRNHDDIMTLNNWQVDFFNMMAGLSWLTDNERDMYEDEMKSYLCYDV